MACPATHITTGLMLGVVHLTDSMDPFYPQLHLHTRAAHTMPSGAAPPSPACTLSPPPPSYLVDGTQHARIHVGVRVQPAATHLLQQLQGLPGMALPVAPLHQQRIHIPRVHTQGRHLQHRRKGVGWVWPGTGTGHSCKGPQCLYSREEGGGGEQGGYTSMAPACLLQCCKGCQAAVCAALAEGGWLAPNHLPVHPLPPT